MKPLSVCAALLFSLSSTAHAAKSFAASNLYYAAGLREEQQKVLFEGLQSAGVKVLRVWLDGQSSDEKGTSLLPFPGLQTDSPEAFDDTVLTRLDDIMVGAHAHGIKLLVSLHSYNALEGKRDFYGKWYGTGDFYTDANAQGYFKERIEHVLAHVNKRTGKTWAQSKEYIFAFEAQNEAMHPQGNPTALASWQCTMAETIKHALDNSTDILVSTGGGAYLANSLLDPYFSCAALDVLAIHAYGAGDLTTEALAPYVQRARANGKKLIMQEWGACYTDAANNNCNGGSPLGEEVRDANIKKWAGSITAAGIPWFYWQILPNKDPHHGWDYEVGVDDVNWGTLKEAGLAAGETEGAFDFGRWLL